MSDLTVFSYLSPFNARFYFYLIPVFLTLRKTLHWIFFSLSTFTVAMTTENDYYISDIYMNEQILMISDLNRQLHSAFFITTAHIFRFVFFIFVGFHIKFVRYNIAYIHR